MSGIPARYTLGMIKFAYTIVFVRDMPKSIAFYRDLIGLPLRMESPQWTEFDSGGCTLALHLAAPGELAPVKPNEIPAGHCHTGFTVDDIDAFALRMQAAGVPVMNPVKLEDFGGRMGVWRDPDGVPVSVIQMPVA